MIESFSEKYLDGKYRWLSNFWPAEIHWLGRTWPTLEHAYQASKAATPKGVDFIAEQTTPGRAKRAGDKLKKRGEIHEDWEQVRVKTMAQLLVRKFAHADLREMLLATGEEHIQESNPWGDTFWGVSKGEGQNILGKLLMELRSNMKTAQDLLEHIKTDERGYEVYIPEDAPQFPPAAFDDLVATAQLVHMDPGYYFITRWNELLQKNVVSACDKTAEAIARKHGYKLLMTRGEAANSLHLELGVPARIQYESSGPDEMHHVGPWRIQFIHMPPEISWWSGHPGGRIIQALRWTREGNAAKTLDVLQGLLPDYVRQDLLDNIDKVPEAWMQELVRKLELQEEA